MVDFRAQELTLLSVIGKLGGKLSIDQLILESDLSDSAIMRSGLVLKERSLIDIFAEPNTIVSLSSEGFSHAKKGLPERRLLNSVVKLGGRAELRKAYETAGLSRQFEKIALGWLLRKKWCIFDSKNQILNVSDSKNSFLWGMMKSFLIIWLMKKRFFLIR